jgi:hypothetical protein
LVLGYKRIGTTLPLLYSNNNNNNNNNNNILAGKPEGKNHLRDLGVDI